MINYEWMQSLTLKQQILFLLICIIVLIVLVNIKIE